VSILLQEAKAVMDMFCFLLNTIGWSGHVTSDMQRDNGLEVQPIVHAMQIRSC